MSEKERETNGGKKPGQKPETFMETARQWSKALDSPTGFLVTIWGFLLTVVVTVVTLAGAYFLALTGGLIVWSKIPNSWRKWRGEHDQPSFSTLIVVSFQMQDPIGFLRAFRT